MADFHRLLDGALPSTEVELRGWRNQLQHAWTARQQWQGNSYDSPSGSFGAMTHASAQAVSDSIDARIREIDAALKTLGVTPGPSS